MLGSVTDFLTRFAASLQNFDLAVFWNGIQTTVQSFSLSGLFSENHLTMVWIYLTYLALYVILPYVVLYPKIRNRGIGERFFISFICSNFAMILIVFLLMFLKICNRFTLLSMIAAVSIGTRVLIDRRAAKTACSSAVRTAVHIVLGEQSLRLIVREKRRRIVGKSVCFVREHILGKLKWWIPFVLIMLYVLYDYSYQCRNAYYFGMPDQYVHSGWIQYMKQGVLFYNGVYPYGFHTNLHAFSLVFDHDVYTMMRFMGSMMTLFIVAALFLLMRKTFRSPYAVFFGFAVFCLSNVLMYESVNRFYYTLPQEYSMIFLYPCAIYLYEFFQTKNRFALTMFAMSFSLTLSVHFYITIVAGMICAAMAVVYIDRVFRKGYFLPLLLAGVISVACALAPLAVGLAMGIKIEGSLTWAANVIQGDKSDPSAPNSSAAEPPESASDLNSGVTSQAEGNPLPDSVKPPPEHMSLREKVISFWYNSLNHLMPQAMKVSWFVYALMMMAAIPFLFLLRLIFRRVRGEHRLQLTMAIYMLGVFILFNASLLGIPELMDFNRSRIFASYCVSFFWAMPLEILYDLTFGWKPTRVVAGVISVGMLGGLLWYIYGMGNVKERGYAFQVQYDAAVQTYYRILEEFPDRKWTIVSPVDETSMVMNRGYHYELVDFMLEMEEFSRHKTVRIPTDHVFIYIEKKPIEPYRSVFYSGQKETSESEPIRREEALLPIPTLESMGYPKWQRSAYYTVYDSRRILEAKAYEWAMEYQKYFPDEMCVYYEDDELIVYHIEQNPYFLNNFAMGYGNNKGTFEVN